MPKTTVSVIKADVGSYPGHSRTHPKLLEKAHKMLRDEEGNLLIDSFVSHCGDDIELIMTHVHGVDNEKIHRFAWTVFKECTKIAKSLKLCGAGQDLPAGAFPGSLRGSGPGVAEMEFEERESDPVLIFMADKAGSGAWNFFLYKIFADPFNTAGLVTDPSLNKGFVFEVHDLVEKRRILFTCPEEIYDLLACIGMPSRYVIRRVFQRDGEIAAVTSTGRFTVKAGPDAGTEDPVMIVRAEGVFPAVGEVIEPFAVPVLVAGWMRGSHYGPLMPVSLPDANATRSNGPSRVTCFGFQICNGELIGPSDMFDDPAFDRARSRCSELADVIRAHGPFAPHRQVPDAKECTALPALEKKFSHRWEPIPE